MAEGTLVRRASERNISFKTAPMKVVVGAQRECFYVHASALAASSEFFKSALKPEWKKKGERVIDLHDQSAESFDVYVQWLYSGGVNTETRPVGRDEKLGPDYEPLVNLYALGEQLNDTMFQDSVIDAIILLSRTQVGQSRWYPSGPNVNTIYENTTTGSPARRLMVDFHVRYGSEKWIRDETENESINHEFLIDLSRALLRTRYLPEAQIADYAELDADLHCKYHIHDKDRPCPGK